MWEAWRLAKAYQQRPSEIYGVHDEVTAWCFDRAVWLFGSELDAELRNAAEGAKNERMAAGRQARVIAKWLGGEVKYKEPGVGAAAGAGGGVVSSDQKGGPVKL